MHTVIFSYLITQIVSTIVMVLLWLQNRKRFGGTLFWVVDFIFQTFGILFIALRGNIPDWISIDFSNALIMTGMLLGLMGLERFVGRRGNHFYNYLLVIAYVFVHTWFTFAHPDLALRTLNSSVFMLIFGLQIIWLMFFRVSPEMKKLTSLVGWVFVIFSFINIMRVVDFFVTEHTATDYFHANGFEAYNIIMSQMVFILLTYSLTLMFNRRLLMQIAIGEEKFSKAFHSSPYAIMLTRLSDGQIFEVNKGFTDITGYEYAEVLGKTTHDFHFWDREEDRALVVDDLQKIGKVHEQEYQFRIKSGGIITGLFSAEILLFNNEKCVLSSINDITYRKRSSEQLREALSYMESLLNYASAPIIVWDADNRITKFNRAFERLSGRFFQEVEGQKIDLLFPDKSKVESLKHIFQTSKGDKWETVEMEIQDREGNIKTVLWNSASIYDSTNENIVATIAQGHEITLRKVAEEQVRQLNEKLEQEVAQRTAELQKTISELEEQSRVFVGRELRIIELTKLVAKMENNLSGIGEKES
jgi:PAS domain S-box-containing protein